MSDSSDSDPDAVMHNHIHYQDRLDFIKDLLTNRFGLDVAETTPLSYDPECPFKYNNFVYRIALREPVAVGASAAAHSGQPGVVPIPIGTTVLLLRLANSDTEGMHPENRVENEVSVMTLARSALATFTPSIVPAVYGWATASGKSQGWILQELMPGTPVDEAFGGMTLVQKQAIFGQMVRILKALQDHPLPASVTGFGGLTFDRTGQMVSAALPSVGAGPWPSYETSFQARLHIALEKADTNVYLRGWLDNGVRDRLDAFAARGVPTQFEYLANKEDRCLIHADFTTNNLLFNASSGQITGLIDYDFSCVLHPSYEFLRSFDGAGGQIAGWTGSDEGSGETALRDAKLYGFPSPLPEPSGEEDGIDWPLAKAWEDELERLNVRRPRNMSGINKVAEVDAVLRCILPWRLSNEDILGLQSEKVKIDYRAKCETQLMEVLERLGF